MTEEIPGIVEEEEVVEKLTEAEIEAFILGATEIASDEEGVVTAVQAFPALSAIPHLVEICRDCPSPGREWENLAWEYHKNPQGATENIIHKEYELIDHPNPKQMKAYADVVTGCMGISLEDKLKVVGWIFSKILKKKEPNLGQRMVQGFKKRVGNSSSGK